MQIMGNCGLPDTNVANIPFFQSMHVMNLEVYRNNFRTAIDKIVFTFRLSKVVEQQNNKTIY
jgi:hypothetical protein